MRVAKSAHTGWLADTQKREKRKTHEIFLDQVDRPIPNPQPPTHVKPPPSTMSRPAQNDLQPLLYAFPPLLSPLSAPHPLFLLLRNDAIARNAAQSLAVRKGITGRVMVGGGRGRGRGRGVGRMGPRGREEGVQGRVGGGWVWGSRGAEEEGFG
jgi:hypothetical protein